MYSLRQVVSLMSGVILYFTCLVSSIHRTFLQSELQNKDISQQQKFIINAAFLGKKASIYFALVFHLS
jgi:hypothetical protein